jgi:hypothetical protein
VVTYFIYTPMKRYEIPKKEFNVHGSVHRKNILIYHVYPTRCNVTRFIFYLETDQLAVPALPR